MDWSLSGSYLHGVFQTEYWSGLPFPTPGICSWPRDRTRVSCVSCFGRQILYHWATWEALEGISSVQFNSVQLLSRVRLFVTPWTAARQASLSITNSWSPPKPMSIESVMPSNHLILCHPLLLLPPIPPSIRVFSSESALRMRWPKWWDKWGDKSSLFFYF